MNVMEVFWLKGPSCSTSIGRFAATHGNWSPHLGAPSGRLFGVKMMSSNSGRGQPLDPLGRQHRPDFVLTDERDAYRTHQSGGFKVLANPLFADFSSENGLPKLVLPDWMPDPAQIRIRQTLSAPDLLRGMRNGFDRVEAPSPAEVWTGRTTGGRPGRCPA